LDSSKGGFMDELDVDFNQSIREISRVYQDIRRLSSLGELPITLVHHGTLRVHFRGCDKEHVEALCNEVGVVTGIIHEDEMFAYNNLLLEVNWTETLSDASGTGSEWEKCSLFSDGQVQIILDALSDGMESPHWGEEAYDEIGAEEKTDTTGSGGFACRIAQYPLEFPAGFMEPWARPVDPL